MATIVLCLSVMSLLGMPTVQLAKADPGVLHVPSSSYPTIQSAVNAASPGDTILVANGTYREKVVVDKSLNLTGASNAGAIVNATGTGGAAITVVNAQNVTIEGFMIVDHDLFNDSLWITGSNHVTVQGNRMTASMDSNATYVYNSFDVNVAGNVLTGNLYGIAIQGGFTNQIEDNNSTGNSAGLIIGLSQANRVTDNVFRLNAFGVRLIGSAGNIIARNTVANNTFAGIYLEGSSANRILENDVDFNKAASTTYGLYFSSSTNNRIYYNNVRNDSIQVYAVSRPGDILQNYWNDSAPVNPKGNFWSGYNGTDNDNDGVGDTYLPWPCPGGGRPCSFNGPPGVDYRPLMAPYPPSLSVRVGAVPDVGLATLQVGFSGLVRGGAGSYSYSWDFGDGTSLVVQNVMSTNSSVTHSYSSLGIYFVSLIVNDSLGASGSDLVAVSVVTDTLEVRVYGSGNQPLFNATVVSLARPPGQAGLSGLTNMSGVALFRLLEPGAYSLQASSAGYYSNSTSVSVFLNRTSVARIFLARVSGSSGPNLLLFGAAGAVGIFAVLTALLLYRRRSKRLSLGTGEAKRSVQQS